MLDECDKAIAKNGRKYNDYGDLNPFVCERRVV